MAAGKKILDFLGNGVPEAARTSLLSNRAWIGGQWIGSSHNATFPVTNPANAKLITEVRKIRGLLLIITNYI